MAGMLDAKFTGDILKYLIGENGEADNFSNLFLAAQCLDEVRNRNAIDGIASQLRDRVKELTKYGNITGSTVLEYYRLVYQIRRPAVAAVTATWKDDPETFPWLKQLAHSDDDGDVRVAAVQELARGWKDDPETLPWLKQLAQSEDNGYVRVTAVEELARGWKDDPELFELLCEVAINDPFDHRGKNRWRNPRQIALAAMIELYPDRPQTLELVRDRAQNDRDQKLREFAQEKLTQLEGK
jgi:HEAT repeat protein